MTARFTRAHAAILATALLFSTGGAAIKACGLNAWQVASFRSGVAAVALALLVPAARRVSWRVLLVAVAYAATLVSFVLANKLTTAAQAVFLQAAAPLYVVFLERWLLGTRMARRDLPILAAIGIGVALLFVGSGQAYVTAPDPVRGNVIAVASGVFYAFLMVGLRWLAADAGAPRGTAAAATLWGNVLAFAAALPFALPVLASRPRLATSVSADAYAAPSTAGCAAGRNWLPLLSTNGATEPQFGNIGAASFGGVGR